MNKEKNNNLIEFRFSEKFDIYRNSKFPLDILGQILNSKEFVWARVLTYDGEDMGEAKLLNKPSKFENLGKFSTGDIIKFSLISPGNHKVDGNLIFTKKK